MKTKNLMAILLAGVLLIGLAAIPATAKPVVLKWAFYQPPTSPITISARWFIKEMEKASDGELVIKPYWAQSLATSKEMMEAVRDNVADLVFMCPAYHRSKTPLSSLSDVPFLVTTGQGGRQNIVFNRACSSPMFTKEYDKWNAKFLYFAYVPPYNLMGKKPVRKLSDLKGKRTRAVGGLGNMLKYFGATPVFIPAPESFSALDKGVMDLVAGCGAYWFNAYKIWEASKYYTTGMDMSSSALIALINKKAYAKLPEKVKKAIPALREQSSYVSQQAIASVEKTKIWRKQFTNHGIEIIEFPPADRAKMKAKADKFWKDWIAQWEKKGVKDAGKALNMVSNLIIEVEKEYPQEMLPIDDKIKQQVAQIEAEMKSIKKKKK